MIYKLTVPIRGVFYMDEPERIMDAEDTEPLLGEYFPDPVYLSDIELAEYEQEIKANLEQDTNIVPMRDKLMLFHGFGVNDLKLLIESTDISAYKENGHLYGIISISITGVLKERDKRLMGAHIKRQFSDTWPYQYSNREVSVPGGHLMISLNSPNTYELQEQKKYKITNHSHPQYAWLHRIQACSDVNESVMAGTLGGYVESEGNLSQDGSCWVHDAAICCENAKVEKDAQIFDGACVRGAALLTGDATMFGFATADGNCVIRSGEIKDHARVAGNAVVGESIIDGLSPLIQGNSRVYGTVRGLVSIKDVVFPGEEIVNPTQDMFLLENGKREVLVKKRELKPPEGCQIRQTKKKLEPER